MPSSLARRYDAATEVERRDDAPSAFRWRRRRHLVTAVHEHWWEAGAWWRQPAGSGDAEFELWRVEARAEGGATTVVAELCFAWARGTWTVRAVLD